MAVPVTVQDAARQLRLQPDELTPDQTTEVTGWIADAAAWVEDYTGQILAARDAVQQFPGFGCLTLSAWPIKPDAIPAVDFSDGAGAAITVSGPRLSAVRRPATVLPATGTRWPPVGPGTVTVTVRAGYEATDTVPGNIRRAMLVLIAAYDADREGGEVFAQAEKSARALCSRLRLQRV